MENINFTESCFFTGHRIIAAAEKAELSALTENRCTRMIEKYGVTHFISGAAMGYDLLAADIVLQLKRRYPQIKLHLYLPCRDQSELWKPAVRAEWERIYALADERRYIYDGDYIKGCMQLRNTAMVNDAYFGIAFCKRRTGGTYSTIKKAVEKGRFICVLPAEKVFGEPPEYFV